MSWLHGRNGSLLNLFSLAFAHLTVMFYTLLEAKTFTSFFPVWL